MRHIFILPLVVLSFLCASCSGYALKPYKMDIQQGNVVNSKMMLQLRPGMTKSQVRFVMGTPLIQDSFHKDRWDYFYQMRKDGKIIEQRRVILDFENEALKRVRGDVVPAGSGQGVVESERLTPPKQEEKGLVDRLKFWKKDEKPVEKSQSVPAELVKPETKAPQTKEPAVVAPEIAQPEAKGQVTPSDSSQDIAFPAPKPASELTPVDQLTPASPKATEVVKPEPAPAAKPAPKPAVPKVEPAKVKAPVQEVPTAVEEVKKPVVTPEPEPVPVPVKQAEPLKPQAPAEQVPAKMEPKPATKPAIEPEPEKDLPPEDAPGYFERMLEKIGF